MKLEFIPILADAMKHYLGERDIQDLSGAFAIDVENDYATGKPAYMSLAKRLVVDVDVGNNRGLLAALIPSLINRAREGVATTDWERRDFHERMVDRLLPIEAALAEGGIPEEVAVSENRPFAAKSEAREFLGRATTGVTIVDNYVGAGTLDCLRDVQHSIRLLTGSHNQAVGDDFARAVSDFRKEGRPIEVRRHPRLHDRYILFNDRAWIVGSSLKDAGKKALNIIECVDSKASIVQDVENKWAEAVEHLT